MPPYIKISVKPDMPADTVRRQRIDFDHSIDRSTA
jgi:hypothetical protein